LVGDENKDIKTRLIEAEKRLMDVETDFGHLSIALEGMYIQVVSIIFSD
jgi:hypothetical protein